MGGLPQRLARVVPGVIGCLGVTACIGLQGFTMLSVPGSGGWFWVWALGLKGLSPWLGGEGLGAGVKGFRALKLNIGPK